VLGCQNTSGMCGACGRGWEKGVPPLPVPSPCNKVDIVLGAGASFEVGFVSVAEACIIVGAGSGGQILQYQLQ